MLSRKWPLRNKFSLAFQLALLAILAMLMVSVEANFAVAFKYMVQQPLIDAMIISQREVAQTLVWSGTEEFLVLEKVAMLDLLIQRILLSDESSSILN